MFVDSKEIILHDLTPYTPTPPPYREKLFFFLLKNKMESSQNIVYIGVYKLSFFSFITLEGVNISRITIFFYRKCNINDRCSYIQMNRIYESGQRSN